LWEATFYRLRALGRGNAVTGRTIIAAANAVEATAEAEKIRGRSRDPSSVVLRLLAPLTPHAPGAHRYSVTFSSWHEHDGVYRKSIVHLAHVDALRAADARALAGRTAKTLPEYCGSWRIEQVRRTDDAVPATSRRSRRRADRHRGQSASLGRLRALAATSS
jgi:hypothetical protein